MNAAYENLRLELRRGCLPLAVLAQLKSEQYGYMLRKSLVSQGIAVEDNTLYPLLRRLELQGLLASEWREQDHRNKRFYKLSDLGRQVLAQLLEEWEAMELSLNRVIRSNASVACAPGYSSAPLDGGF